LQRVVDEGDANLAYECSDEAELCSLQGSRKLAIAFSNGQPNLSFNMLSASTATNITTNPFGIIVEASMAAVSDWAQSLLSPSPLGLIIAILFVISIPLFLHSVVFRASGLVTLPSILLIGPSGSGKTSLLTLVRSSVPSP
jgi:hypothetical protein